MDAVTLTCFERNMKSNTSWIMLEDKTKQKATVIGRIKVKPAMYLKVNNMKIARDRQVLPNVQFEETTLSKAALCPA